jgi:hypothetical protein
MSECIEWKGGEPVRYLEPHSGEWFDLLPDYTLAALLRQAYADGAAAIRRERDAEIAAALRALGENSDDSRLCALADDIEAGTWPDLLASASKEER